jgi:hypothetical protein
VANRSTVRRRRRFLVLSSVVFIVLATVFIRDVVHAARESETNRSALNRSFAVLVNANLREQNAIDVDTLNLLRSAKSLSRSAFESSLAVLHQRVDRVREAAAQLSTPRLAGDINLRFIQVTSDRAAAWNDLAEILEVSLRIPHRDSHRVFSVRTTAEDIQTSNATWEQLRGQLRSEPGSVRLHESRWGLGSLTEQDVARVSRLANLQPLSAAAISAIAIDPQPLPSRSAQIVLLPKTSIGIGVSVRNTGRVTSTLSITVATRWRRAAPVTVTARRTVAAGTSVAVVFPEIPTYPGMRGTLSVRVTGAAPAFPGATTRQYSVKVAPSD